MIRTPARATAKLAHLLACLLLLTTAIALLATARATWFSTAQGTAQTSPGSIKVANRFYAAVNHFLATGDSAPLRAVVADDFVQHPAPPFATRDATGLIRKLESMRLVDPGLRFTVDRLVASADGVEISAAVHAVAGPTRPVLVRSLPPQLAAPSGTTIELLRIDSGRVTERWAEATAGAAIRALTVVDLPLSRAAVPREFSLVHLTLGAYASLDLANGFSSRVLLAEHHGLVWERLAHIPPGPANSSLPLPVPTAASPAPPVALDPGTALVTGTGDTYRLTNTSVEPAGLLLLVRHGASTGANDSPDLATLLTEELAGISATLLARATLPVHQYETVAFGQVAIAAGAGVDWSAANGTLISVVQVFVDQSGVRAEIERGESIIQPPGEPASWQAVGDALLSVVMLSATIESSPIEPSPVAG